MARSPPRTTTASSRDSARDGRVIDLHWIDGLKPDFTLHAPKGMAFRGDELVVADLEAVRVFDRKSGAHIRDYQIPDSYMLNDVAVGDDGKIYVTDTGGDYGTPPGAVYAIGDDGKPSLIAQGREARAAERARLRQRLVARRTVLGKRRRRLQARSPAATRLPTRRCPRSSSTVSRGFRTARCSPRAGPTSSVYRLLGSHAELLATGILTPAQISYDPKHSQLLVPDPLENQVVLFPIEWR